MTIAVWQIIPCHASLSFRPKQWPINSFHLDYCYPFTLRYLTPRGRVTHKCVSNDRQVIIGSDNGLSPVRRQANIWTNTDLLSIVPLGSNLSEISFKIKQSFDEKMELKISSAKWRPFCFVLNVLMPWWGLAVFRPPITLWSPADAAKVFTQATKLRHRLTTC